MIKAVAHLLLCEMVKNLIICHSCRIKNIDRDKGGCLPTIVRDYRKPHDPPFAWNQIDKICSTKVAAHLLLCDMVENLTIHYSFRINLNTKDIIKVVTRLPLCDTVKNLMIRNSHGIK